MHFIEHEDKWNEKNIGRVRTKRLVGKLADIDDLLAVAELDINDCVTFISIFSDSIEIKIQELNKHSITKHIECMEALAEELP